MALGNADFREMILIRREGKGGCLKNKKVHTNITKKLSPSKQVIIIYSICQEDNLDSVIFYL